MRDSQDRILTTHSGSLPRPPALLATLRAHVAGNVSPDEFDHSVRDAVLAIATSQVEAGVDVISDGEMSKVAFNSYASRRLSGLGGACERRPSTEEKMFPDLGEYLLPQHGVAGNQFPVCTGPLEYVGHAEVRRDVENLRLAESKSQPEGVFLTAASPGTLCSIFGEGYYARQAKFRAMSEGAQIATRELWQV